MMLLGSWAGIAWWTSSVCYPGFRQANVDKTDVASQQSSSWTLQKWATYLKTAPQNGEFRKIHNVISLEITGTDLAKRVRPPRIVREIDWVDNFWNFGPGGKAAVTSEKSDIQVTEDNVGIATKRETTDTPPPKARALSVWPKVQLYCLVSRAHSPSRVRP